MVTRSLNYTISAYGCSDIGRFRDNNEDFWAVDVDANVYVLADGMGGHKAGEVAAKEAVETFSNLIKKFLGKDDKVRDLKQTRIFIQEIIKEVNSSINRKARKDCELKGMGTTLCCVYFHEEGCVLGHVGDSRIYLLRENKLNQLTEDHSLVAELVELGELNERQAREYAYRNIITKAIGTEPIIEPTVSDCDFAVGDWVMMCSDGLSDLLSHADIERILVESSSKEDAVKTLIDGANKLGGPDNITVVLMQVQESYEKKDIS